MADLVNLNRARKARAKADKAAKASENRAKFGRTGLQKALDAARTEIEARRLDQARRDPKDR